MSTVFKVSVHGRQQTFIYLKDKPQMLTPSPPPRKQKSSSHSEKRHPYAENRFPYDNRPLIRRKFSITWILFH